MQVTTTDKEMREWFDKHEVAEEPSSILDYLKQLPEPKGNRLCFSLLAGELFDDEDLDKDLSFVTCQLDRHGDSWYLVI